MIKKVFLIIFISLFVFSLSSCNSAKGSADFSETKAICELATLKCYYHNTSELRQDSSGLGKYLGNIGYKKAWIEYDGIVKLGIDASQVTIEPVDNIVKVYVPDAKILSVDVDEKSLAETVSETGWFTRITTQERAEALGKAQDDMRANAESNTALLLQATQRTKEIFKGYILNVGSQIGIDYKIEWIGGEE